MLVNLGALAGFIAVGHAAASGKRATEAAAYSSNSAGNYKLSSIAAPVQGSGSPGSASTWKLTVDDTASGHRQTINGFGAAVTDATVTSFNTLNQATLQQLLNELMTTDGANFSLMRHTIGASDLSGDPAYTYDDNNNAADPSLTGFNLGDRGTAMAKLLATMKTLQTSLTILGSSWSPPGWMKLNGVIDGSTTNNNLNDGYLTSGGTGSTGYAAAFAQYFVKYIQAYTNLGAPVDAITIQNEPLNSQAGYPTMYVYAYESADLIEKYVGPALAQAGLDTKVWAYDHNTDVPSYPQTILSSGASTYVPAVAWHCYASNVDWTVLSSFHTANPNTEQYMTECWTPASGAWHQAADFTMGPLQNYAAGVMAWTLGTDANDGPHLSSGGCATCHGLVTVNSATSYTLNTAYYMMAQFSKFMPPGAVVVSGTGSYTYDNGGGVQSVASVNPDGSRTVVIQNTFGNAVYVTVTLGSGGVWSGNVPEESVTTWVLPG